MSFLILKHIPLLEDPIDDGEGEEHEGNYQCPGPCGVAYEVAELDIHTEEAGYQGRRHEHEGNEGEHLHYLVLVEIDDGDHSILEVLKMLKTEVCMVDE